MQDDGDHRRLQGRRALDGQVDRGWCLGFDPVAMAAERPVGLQSCTDGGDQVVEGAAPAGARPDDDLKLGLKSSAILFGRHDKRIIGALQLATLLILLGVGQLMGLGSGYYWGLLGAAALFVYQQRLIRERQREACFQAFLNNNYVGALVLLGVMVHYL